MTFASRGDVQHRLVSSVDRILIDAAGDKGGAFCKASGVKPMCKCNAAAQWWPDHMRSGLP